MKLLLGLLLFSASIFAQCNGGELRPIPNPYGGGDLTTSCVTTGAGGPYLPLAGGTVTGPTTFNNTLVVGSTTPPSGHPPGTASAGVFYSTSDAFNVVAYGAKCDGTTDDTVAIQAAISAASVAGGSVTFPEGICNFTSLTITAIGVSLKGQGMQATFLHNTAANSDAITFLGTSPTNIGLAGVSNLTLSGPSSGTGRGLVTTYTADFFTTNVRILNQGGDGWSANNTYTGAQINLVSEFNGGIGFRCTTTCNALSFIGGRLGNNSGTAGFTLEGNYRTIALYGTVIESNAGEGIVVSSSGFGLTVDSVYFEANNGSATTGDDIRFTSASSSTGLTIRGCQFSSNSHTATVRVDSGSSILGHLLSNSGAGTSYFIDDQGDAYLSWSAANNSMAGKLNRLGSTAFGNPGTLTPTTFYGNNTVPGSGLPVVTFQVGGGALPFAVIDAAGNTIVDFTGTTLRITGDGSGLPFKVVNNTAGNSTGVICNSAKGGIAIGDGAGKAIEALASNCTSVNLTIDGNTGAVVSNGGYSFATVGGGITYKAGSNARTGSGALSGGTLAVTNTSVTANSQIFIQDTGGGVVGNIGSLYVASQTAATGFTVTSTNPLDTSNFKYYVFETN